MDRFTLDDLAAIIAARGKSTAAASYTKSRCSIPAPAGCAKKFGEEAVEFVIAAVEGDDKRDPRRERRRALSSACRCLRPAAFRLRDVLDELERRTRQSGHQEKASRQSALG